VISWNTYTKHACANVSLPYEEMEEPRQTEKPIEEPKETQKEEQTEVEI